ncbi:MAG: prohibitin family protein [Ruminococcus sp.]|nr:prohibitin family protein [Ruminococcus sp.]
MNNNEFVDIKNRKGKPKTGLIALIAVLVIFGIIVLFSAGTVVPAGSTGVVVTLGSVSENTYSEGFHFKIPFVQSVEIVSNKIQVYETDASAVSKDLQTVNSKIAVNFRVRSDASASIYKNIGADYQQVILMPAVQESMKAISAKYNAEQLITNRNQVGQEIKEQLESKVSEYGIQIEKFNIVNFDFSAEFNSAIEQKQVAEQNLLKTRTEQEEQLVIADADAQKKIKAANAEAAAIKAKADAQAEANKVLTESITDELIRYQMLEKWDGSLPKVSSSANPLISIGLEDLEGNTKTNNYNSNANTPNEE